MADHDIPVHESPIRTPKQLITVIVLSFIIPIGLAALLAKLASSGMRGESENLAPEAVAERIKPVATVTLNAGGGEAKGAQTGEQVVQAVCGACHTSGAAGAPKIGDKGAWAARIGQGQKTLVQHAIAGIRGMPPKGGNPDFTDVEIERAVVVMANQSGGSLKEPPAPKAAPAKGDAKK
jgi:cytochrome c5